MAISPWAQLEQQSLQDQKAQQAITPPVFAPVGDMPSAPPDVGASHPLVRLPTSGEEQLANTRGQLQKIHDTQARPYGFAGAAPSPEHPEGLAPNHPGKLGKIAHVFSNIGNIAGDIFAPDVMAHIPGTQMNREVKENELTKRLEQENTEQSLENERGATQAKEEEALRESQENAPAEHHIKEATASNLENPPEKWLPVPGVAGPNGEPMEHNGAGLYRVAPGSQGASMISSDKVPKENDFEQFYKDYLTDSNLPDSAHNRLQARSKFAAAGQLPQRPPIVQFVVPGQNGNQTLQTFRSGQDIPQNAMTPQQMGTVNVGAAKGEATDKKTVKTLDGQIDMMKQFAKENTGAGDFGILMNYAGAVKPENIGKLRWQKNEQDYIEGLRGTVGDIDAWAERIHNGARLPTQQRDEMIHAVQIVRDAKARELGQGGGGEQNGPPPGAKVIKWSDVR